MNTNKIEKFKSIAGVILLLAIFGFIFIYFFVGLLNEDVLLRVRFLEPRNMVFTGYAKVLLCFSGMGLSLPILYIITKTLYMKALKSRKEPNKGSVMKKLWLPIIAFSFTGFIVAYIWQSLLLPVYR